MTNKDNNTALSNVDLLSSHSALLTALDTFSYSCNLPSLFNEHEKSLNLNSVLRDASENVSERLNYIISDKTVTQRKQSQTKLLE